MINITISCDFCGKDSGFTVSCSPGNLLNNYKVFKDDLITAKFWVYHTFNKRWYCPDSFVDEMVEKKANEWAKEVGETEPDWRRKQIVRDFTEGFKLAKALYCKEEKKND